MRSFVVGFLAGVLLVGYWPWVGLLILGACASWRRYRLHQRTRIEFDTVGGRRIGEIPSSDAKSGPSCWSLGLDKGIIDARPAGNGSRGSGSSQQPSHAVYTCEATDNGQGFEPRTTSGSSVKYARSNSTR